LKKYIIFLLTVPAIVVIDRITKAYIDSTMALHDSLTVIPGFFSITYVRNPGAAFGFLAGASPMFRSIFFLGITAAAIGLILYYISKSQNDEPLLIFSLSLILSGAVGNFIDRIKIGEVIDFLDVYIGSHHWPAFNVADSAISVGAVILIIAMYRRGKSRNTADPKAQAQA
jgi:signal peptidase II